MDKENFRKPYLIIFSTMTIDGRIASKTWFSNLSCPKDLERLHKLRAETGAVMIGAETVIKDDPSLRLKYFKGDDPYKIIIDGLLRVPISARVFTINPEKAILFTSKFADEEKIRALKEKGVRVFQFETKILDLREVLNKLYELGLKKIMVEGGGVLNWNLLNSKLVDELRITISPYVFGKGRSVFDGEGYANTSESPKFELKSYEICECGNEVHLIYKVNYS
jgi:2,5-diamino-6-(ribosylamino)-4(3H)-pyrimidinone 5'-phosphate reductase